ncbi:MAG: UPF0755 protein [Candidatus Peregrinibacteria bacterium Gr01-1014_25]|nr:MAG: UPF0755 protein [Candidatus Peregrinibacteria bacterium Gr01-1014_25]
MRKALIVFVVLLLGFGLWMRAALGPADIHSQAREIVEIPRGFSTEQIADLLEERGVIRSSLAFRLYATWKGLDARLQAGSFVLDPSLTIRELLEALTSGVASEGAVTIPEGFAVADIDALLTSKKLIDVGTLMRCAQTCDVSSFDFLPSSKALAERGGRIEGYLFPDTYFVIREGFTPQAFLDRLLATFNERVVRDMKREIAASGRSLHQIVTMASLVEEEAASDEERPVIAGILWKRLDNGVVLGVDASVRYILGKSQNALTAADLDVDSPYNIRKRKGLPPGPIASPGLASIRAALAPEQSEFWYYLHDANGNIHYAGTNEEHNENRAKYLR